MKTTAIPALPPAADTSTDHFNPRFWREWIIALRQAWRRHQRARLEKAIQSYSSEKHFLTRGYQPVVGRATMRASLGEIERNRLPFHSQHCRPWRQEVPQAPALPGPDTEFSIHLALPVGEDRPLRLPYF